MPSILVLGATGLLGSTLVPTLHRLGHKVLAQSRGGKTNLRLDPLDRSAVTELLVMHCPEVIINLIGATNVDQCESDPSLAWKGNVEVVSVIVDSIKAAEKITGNKIHLIHISTDQVYGGSGPHSEGAVNLINVYALSKYTGELIAEKVSATILRTNFVGRSQCPDREGFTDWIVSSLKNNIPITLFDDINFSALHIDTLCQIIARCIDKRPAGIFNAGTRDSMSKARFALTLANLINAQPNNFTFSTSEGSALKARRPNDMSLQVSKLEKLLALEFPKMNDELTRTAKEYENDSF